MISTRSLCRRSARTVLTNSRPLIPGMFQSTRATRMLSPFRASIRSASSASAAMAGSNPRRCSVRPRIMRMARESSITMESCIAVVRQGARGMRAPHRIGLKLKLRHERAQLAGHAIQRPGRRLGVGSALGGALCCRGYTGDVTRNVLGTACRLGHVAADLVGGCGLLFHAGGDGIRNIVDLVDDGSDIPNRFDRPAGVLLNRFNLLADIFGGPRGFFGQFLDFVGDHGE